MRTTMIGMVMIGVLALGGNAHGAAYVDAVMADNPTSYWRLNDPNGSTTAADSAVNPPVNTGFVIGSGPTFGLPGAPIVEPGNTAMSNSAGINALQSYNVEISPSFTAELWAKSATPTWTDSYATLASSRDPNGFMMLTATGKNLWFWVMDSAGVAAGTLYYTPTIDITQWHHYALTYDHPTLTAAMYIDGQLATSAAFSPFTRTTGTLGNFNMAYDNGHGLNGTIDEVAIYGYALSGGQIAEHFATTVPEPSVAGLLLAGFGGWWLRRKQMV